MSAIGSYQVPSGDVAVLLNANAGRVRRSLVRKIRRAAPDAVVLWTRTMEEADDAIEAALESEVSTLFAGGGDGTIIELANRLLRFARSPRLGILKLGTGNALATWAGARTPTQDLTAWSHGEAFTEQKLRFVHAEGDFFPFAGMGWDAAVLNDYRWAKQQLKSTPFEGMSHHLTVYLGAAFGRTVPRIATTRKPPIATVEVLSGTAWKVDRHGSRVGTIFGPGDVLYEGPAHMTAFGTTPYYGYAMRMLPHACALDSHLHLRCSALSIPTTVNELPRIWTGEFEHPKLLDFLVEHARVRFDEDVPYQVGGDARGMRRELEVRMGPLSLPVLSFRAPE